MTSQKKKKKVMLKGKKWISTQKTSSIILCLEPRKIDTMIYFILGFSFFWFTDDWINLQDNYLTNKQITSEEIELF